MLLVIDTSCIISTVTILQRYIAYIQPNFYDCKALQNTRSIYVTIWNLDVQKKKTNTH